MKRIVLFALSLLLVCCNSEDKTITTPAAIEVSVDKVGATKVWFSVKSSSPDAAYIYRGVSDFDDMEDIVKFRDYLTSHGLFSTIRASRGEDIFAACGMLSTAKQEGFNEDLT